MPDDMTLQPVQPVAGLAGLPPIPIQQEQPAPPPAVEGPATEGPANPGQSIARHIMAALGGSNGQPMDWAKGILAGGLAGAANVGKVPEGAGWLAGASRGVLGAQEFQRQKMLDQQRLQQQQFENNLKTQQSTRAEKELQIQMQNANVQRARWTAEIAGMTQQQNENAFKFEQYKQLAPIEYEKAKLSYQAEQDKIDEAHGEMIGLYEAVTGKKVSDLPLVKNSADLNADHAQQAGAGLIFPLHNGESHAAGEDNVGVHIVPGNVWEQTIKHPFTFTDNEGEKVTAQPGTSFAELAGIEMGKMKAAQQKQLMAMQPLEIAAKQAQIGEIKARTSQAYAETHKALSEAGLGGLKPADPVIGYDAGGNAIMTNAKDAQGLGLHDVMKPDAAMVEKATIARSYIALNNQLQADVDQLEKDGKLGKIATRWNEFMTGKVGVGDPDFEKFRVDIGLANTALMQFHVGQRGGSQMLEHFENLANGKKMDAKTLRAGIEAEGDYAKHRAMLTPQLEKQIMGEKLREMPNQVPIGGTPILKDGKTIGYIQNGKRTDF